MSTSPRPPLTSSLTLWSITPAACLLIARSLGLIISVIINVNIKIEGRNGCIVVRPDSGDPATMVLKTLQILGKYPALLMSYKMACLLISRHTFDMVDVFLQKKIKILAIRQNYTITIKLSWSCSFYWIQKNQYFKERHLFKIYFKFKFVHNTFLSLDLYLVSFFIQIIRLG